MLKVYFLKKKRFTQYKTNNFYLNVKPGKVIFFEYFSLDRDLFYKYKLYGLCVGLKKNLLMSCCYLNGILFGNQVSYVFYLFSPLLYNLKIFGIFFQAKSKKYLMMPKIRYNL